MDKPQTPSPFRQRTLQLQERTFRFAKAVLQRCPRQYRDDPSRAIWRQLIRAAPSASGNLDEADEAMSDADFLFKMKLVLRETKEARRWLRFIRDCKLHNHDQLDDLSDEARQLTSIFATIIINKKKSMARKKAVQESRQPSEGD
jgi:four helix bundle protein